jgi:hypothetical protein
MLGSSWVAAQQAASQEGFSSMKLVRPIYHLMKSRNYESQILHESPCCVILSVFPPSGYLPKMRLTVMRSPSSLCVCVSLPYQILNVWINLDKTWFVYHGNWVHLKGILHKSFPSACLPECIFILSLQSNVSVKCSPPFGARQRLGTVQSQRIHATTGEFLCAIFSMQSVSYRRIVCESVCVTPFRVQVKIR